MNDLAVLLTSINVDILFNVTRSIADEVGKFLSPALLLIAIYIRLMETQVDGLVGGGKYGTALRDMLIWSFVLGSYYAIGSYIIEFANPIYAWLDSFGSIQATTKSFVDLMAKNKVALDAGGVSIMGIVSAPYTLFAMFFYYSTLIILSFLATFLKIANVMAFGVAFIWGLIAIPISISTTFRILKGWAFLCAFVLVWPIVQGLMMAMFAMLFTSSTVSLMSVPDTNPTLMAANIMMLFAVMHLLLGAVMVSAPFIANALVTNSSAAAGIVMPFVAAASAAGVATAKGFSGARGAAGMGGIKSSTAKAGAVNAGPSPRSFNVPSTRQAAGSAATVANSIPDAAVVRNSSANSAPAAAPASSTPGMSSVPGATLSPKMSMAGNDGGAVDGSGAIPDAQANKQQQRRRGVLINKLQKTLKNRQV